MAGPGTSSAGTKIHDCGARDPISRTRSRSRDVMMQAHSAPLQLVFYQRGNFPTEYKGSAFVTMHGSWNRDQRTGYKVVRLLFDGSGRPTGEYEDFMTGFVCQTPRSGVVRSASPWRMTARCSSLKTAAARCGG